MSGGNQTITDLGNWLTGNRDSIDRTNKAAVEDYNKKVDIFSQMQEQNPVLITTFGGTKEIVTETGGKRVVTTTTGTTGSKVYASEWDKFVEGSGRVMRYATGMTLAKQKAYFQTIKGDTSLLGEVKRGVFYFGTEIVNKPAELAPAALTGFGIGKVVAGAPGFLARVGEGTGLTAKAAQFVQTPGGASLVKAGAAGVFGGAYTWGVTEGLSASPEKTKENIYRSTPTLVAMYGGAGGFNWVGETRVVRGMSSPAGATFKGVQIQDAYFGGGRTPSGGKYVGAFSPTESYVITGRPRPVTPRARTLELPDLRPKQPGYVDADIGGDWVKPAQLPDYATTMETKPQSAGGMYARPESVRDMTWDRPLVERNAKGYAPSDVTQIRHPASPIASGTIKPAGKSIEQIQADAFFGTKHPFYEIGDAGIMQPQPQPQREPEPSNPLNPKRVYAEPTPIRDSTKRMFDNIHISGVPDRVVKSELENMNRGGLTERGMMTQMERGGAFTKFERQMVNRERERGFAFAPSFIAGSTLDTRNADRTISKLSERKKVDTMITPWDRTRTVPATNAPGITSISTPFSKRTTTALPYQKTSIMDTTTPFSKQTTRIAPYEITTPRELIETDVTPQEQEFPWKKITDNPPPPRIITPDPYKFTPINPIGGGFPGGGGGGRQYGNLGVTQWQRENLVADLPYLSRGIGARDFGFADDRQSLNPFAGSSSPRKRRSKKRKK